MNNLRCNFAPYLYFTLQEAITLKSKPSQLNLTTKPEVNQLRVIEG